MAMEEWIEHYFWQGADLLILLDNNSTDGGAEIAKKHSNVIVIDAPKPHAQDENYFTIGYPCAIKNDVDVIAVLDLDEFMFGQDGRPLKSHVEKYINQGYSQISVHWTMFGSSGHINQPKSIRKSFTWRKKTLQTNLKSIWKVSHVKEIRCHKSIVRGPTLEVTSGIQLNHYKIQSKEFYTKIKMKRGDAQLNNWNESRDWATFVENDFHDIEDFQLVNLLENRPSTPIPSEVETFWGIMEHNPFDWRDKIPFLTVSLPVSLVLLCFLRGFLLRVLSVSFFIQVALLSESQESNQIERNRKVGRFCFAVLALLSLFKT
jgi:hypothetical protein